MPEEDVDRAIIKPMCRLYPPPHHLRADEDTLQEALAVYRRALARFGEEVLERAWRRVVEEQTVWCWPKVGVIVQAAEQARRELHPHGQADARFERAEALRDAYVKEFMRTSAHAARAREGGYEAELRRYMEAASWPQAQFIAGRLGGQAYESGVLFQNGESAEERQAWFDRARRQAESGQIRVTVAAELAQRWAQQAGGRRGRG